MNPLVRVWLGLRGSGWFAPGTIGTLLPFPQSWQGWAVTGGYVAALLGTAWLHGDGAAPLRIALTAAYIVLGMVTYA